MALLNETLITSAKRQLPNAFTARGSLPYRDALLPAPRLLLADPYDSDSAGLDDSNNPLLSRNDDGGDVEEAISELGIEALAFYISFHKTTVEGEWGILYIGSRMSQFGAVVSRELLLPPARGLALAFDIVRRHEMYHFRFDLYALHQELTLGRPLYNLYHEAVYRKVFCTDSCFEEALANLSVLRGAHQISRAFDISSAALSGFLRRTFKNSPPGYSNFDDPVELLRSGLGGQIATGSTGATLSEPQSVWVGSAGPFFSHGCPQMILISDATTSHAAPQLRLKQGGRIWDFHRNDADPFPSNPHGHDIEDGCKLSLYNGRIWDPRTKQFVGKESLSTLRELRSRLQRKWPDAVLPPLAGVGAT